MKDTSCKFSNLDVSDKVFAKLKDNIAIYNLSPIVPGHSLVVPLEQIESLRDLSDDKLYSFFSFAKKVTDFLMDEFNATGFNWTIQDGWSGGQTIPHLHLHIIPRQDNDLSTPGDWYPELKKTQEENIDSQKRSKLTNKEMEKIVTHLRSKWQERFENLK